jgi:uncharacterized protein (DUF1810 family)
MPAQPNDRYDLQRFVDAQASIFNQDVVHLSSNRRSRIESDGPALRHLRTRRSDRLPAARDPWPAIDPVDPLVNHVTGRSVEEIFGYPDNLKFRSSVTLFASVAPDDNVFRKALEKYFAGQPDAATLRLL